MRVVSSSAPYNPSSVIRNFKTTVLTTIQSVTAASAAALGPNQQNRNNNNNKHRLLRRGGGNRNNHRRTTRSSGSLKNNLEHHHQHGSRRQRGGNTSLRRDRYIHQDESSHSDDDEEILVEEAIIVSSEKHYRYNFSHIEEEEDHDETFEESSTDDSDNDEANRPAAVIPSVSTMLHAIGSDLDDCAPGEPLVFADKVREVKRADEKDTVHLLSNNEEDGDDESSSNNGPGTATTKGDSSTQVSELVEWRSDSHVIGGWKPPQHRRRSDSLDDDECYENIPVELTLTGCPKTKNRLLNTKKWNSNNKKEQDPVSASISCESDSSSNNKKTKGSDPVLVFDAHVEEKEDNEKEGTHSANLDNKLTTTIVGMCKRKPIALTIDTGADNNFVSSTPLPPPSNTNNSHKDIDKDEDDDGLALSAKSSKSSSSSTTTRSTPEWSLKTHEKLAKQSTYQHSPKKIIVHHERVQCRVESATDSDFHPFAGFSSEKTTDTISHDDVYANPFFNPTTTHHQKKKLSVVVESSVAETNTEADFDEAAKEDVDVGEEAENQKTPMTPTSASF